MKVKLIIFIFLTTLTLMNGSHAWAQNPPVVPNSNPPVVPNSNPPVVQNCDPKSPLGCVTTPIGTGIFANNKEGSGLIVLLRAFLTLIFTVSGIYAFIRVLLAGLKFMSAGGDPKTIQASWESIWQAMLGVVIVVSSLIIAVILGQILFGDATAILIPKIYPAGG